MLLHGLSPFKEESQRLPDDPPDGLKQLINIIGFRHEKKTLLKHVLFVFITLLVPAQDDSRDTF